VTDTQISPQAGKKHSQTILDTQFILGIRKRFMAVNQDRLERMRVTLGFNHKTCLDAVALLFHFNHPALPGFTHRDTPCGIAGFTFDKAQKDIAKKLSATINTLQIAKNPCAILGLYVMGSVGTVAQNKQSDLDIWVCHSSTLDHDALDKLHQKCKNITQWAKKQHLEMHFFIVDEHSHRNTHTHKLDSEHSGTAQKVLLLDEFYRTAIHLAGQTPAWWFVPPEKEAQHHDYLQGISHHHIIRDSLNFGGVASIPSGEFIGAAIWQLYKAIESPYKSLLKLLLLEAYSNEHPHTKPLSLSFKEKVYSGETDITKLDAYHLAFEKIEHYLMLTRQQDRLNLAKRCFYFKTGAKLSHAHNESDNWKTIYLKNCTQEWGWSQQTLAFLDSRNHWKVNDVASERSFLVNELNHCYQLITHLALRHASARVISPQELTILGRKLQAAFEKRPGKIDCINPGIACNLEEPQIGLRFDIDQHLGLSTWTLISFDTQKDDNTYKNNIHTENPCSKNLFSYELKTSINIVEIIFWGLYNGIITNQTTIHIDNKNTDILPKVKKIIRLLSNWEIGKSRSIEHHHFESKSKPISVFLLLNAPENKRNKKSKNQNMPTQITHKKNKIKTIDMLIQSNWGEINVKHFKGEECLKEALEEYLQLAIPLSQDIPPDLLIENIDPDETVSENLSEKINETITLLYKTQNKKHTHYIFEKNNTFISIKNNLNSKFSIKQCNNESELIDYLSEPYRKPHLIKISASTRLKSPLQLLEKHQKNGCIQVFYHASTLGLNIYVLDEHNSLFTQVTHGNNSLKPLKSLTHFLYLAANRLSKNDETELEDAHKIFFYEISNGNNGLTCKTKNYFDTPQNSKPFQVKAIAHEVNNKILFDYYCDNQEFCAVSFGDQIEIVIAQFVLSLRGSHKDYPIHISDIDLSLCARKLNNGAPLQSIHYLNAKKTLENKINHAITVLSKY